MSKIPKDHKHAKFVELVDEIQQIRIILEKMLLKNMSNLEKHIYFEEKEKVK